MNQIQNGATRDKVAARDPAMAPATGDSEAAGTPAGAAMRADEAAQAEIGKARVPRVDASRAVSTHDFPGRRRTGALAPLAAAGLAVAAVVALALWLTLPGV